MYNQLIYWVSFAGKMIKTLIWYESLIFIVCIYMSIVIETGMLKQLVDKLDRLEDDKKNVLDDMKTVYNEAKSQGFDVKTLKKIIKMRRMDRNKLEEDDALLETYRNALGV